MVVLALSMPHAWHAPRPWFFDALCIHDGLKRDAHGHVLYRTQINGHPNNGEGAWNANTGNGYYGGMQFLLSTWRSVGGKIRPDLASPREQLFRSWLVYRRDGNSWREWGTARACGLR